ncbi:MAG TPA: hypothetical protein VFB63_19345 [Bryobacteraceae bacterium]|nr:hypothetical protein [Bryobacteraceae bacterium]
MKASTNTSEPIQHDLFAAPVLDPKKACDARDEGMRRVENHADSDEQAWTDRAYAFLLGFAQSGAEFMVEDVRQAAAGVLPSPPDRRAWGPVALRAARSGQISVVRYEKQKDVKSHRSPKPVWQLARPK